MKKICVIGSHNIDMSVKMDRLPQTGETVLTDSFELFVGGGKGGNQAVAAGRLGADVRMVGLLGDLFYGAEYLKVLAENGVRHDTVGLLENEYPGVAYVAVNEEGHNLLFVYSGSNMKVTAEYVEQHWDVISACDIFLFQQEIPHATNLYAMRRLKASGDKLVILDPAPATGFLPEYLELADIITPNEVEMEMISGIAVRSEETFREACNKLHGLGAKTVVAKAGRKGAYLSESGRFTAIPTYDVKVVDTTAAGDSFNAGMAYGLSLGLDLRQSIRIGHAVASVSTTRQGAQTAMPDGAGLIAFLRENDSTLAREFEKRVVGS